MPPPERAGLHQKAMLWEASGYDRDGQPTVSDTAVEVRVRWEEGNADRLDRAGQQIVVDVTVAVWRDIPLGSIMWEGSEEDLDDEPGTSGFPASDLFEVVTKDRQTDVKGRITRYEYGLKRYRDSMPDTV